MPLRPLTNDIWGFPVNCYVCEPTNSRGLQVQFWHDEEAGIVSAEFELDDGFSGAPSYIHGGVLLALLDEAAAWAAIALAGKWAVTRDVDAGFERPARVGQRYRVEARVEDAAPELITVVAEIRDQARGARRAGATVRLVPLDADQAADAGADFGGAGNDHGSYLSD